METKTDVKINGMEYTVVSNEPEEYVQRVALLVNKKISEVKNSNGHLSTAMLAVMAGMNLADELLKCEDSAARMRAEMSEYMEDARKNGAELEEKKLEVENLKEDMHKLEIELAKRDTELDNLRMINRRAEQQAEPAGRYQSRPSVTQSASQPTRQVGGYSVNDRSRQDSPQIREMQAKYGSSVIGRGMPKKTTD